MPKTFSVYSVGWLVGWLIGFNDISTFVGYLTSNPVHIHAHTHTHTHTHTYIYIDLKFVKKI